MSFSRNSRDSLTSSQSSQFRKKALAWLAFDCGPVYSGVCPPWFLMVGSAPFFSKTLAVVYLQFAIAKWRGESPFLSCASKSAPKLIKAAANSVDPHSAAIWSGVW